VTRDEGAVGKVLGVPEAQGRTRPWMRLFDLEGRVVPTADEAARQREEEAQQRAEALAAKLAEYERRFGPLD